MSPTLANMQLKLSRLYRLDGVAWLEGKAPGKDGAEGFEMAGESRVRLEEKYLSFSAGGWREACQGRLGFRKLDLTLTFGFLGHMVQEGKVFPAERTFRATPQRGRGVWCRCVLSGRRRLD